MSLQLGGFVFIVAVLYTCPLMMLPDLERQSMYRKLCNSALGVMVFLAIFALSGEFALRLFFWGGESFGSHSGPIVKRFERDFTFNQFDGPSRGPQPAGPKQPNQTIIMIQGDSITWGQAIQNEKLLYPELLLNSLRNSGASIDMAVLARPGREIDGHLEQLQKWGEQLAPDVIIYQWYVNDLELNKSQRSKRSKPWRRLFFSAYLARTSYLWWFLDYSITSLLPPEQSYEDYISQRYAEGSSEWLAFEQVFLDWARQAKKLTPRVMVALYPRLSMIPGEPPVMTSKFATIHYRMLALCAQEELLCSDLTDRFLQFGDSGNLKVSSFDEHPSVQAHDAVAGVLHDSLEANWPEILK